VGEFSFKIFALPIGHVPVQRTVLGSNPLGIQQNFADDKLCSRQFSNVPSTHSKLEEALETANLHRGNWFRKNFTNWIRLNNIKLKSGRIYIKNISIAYWSRASTVARPGVSDWQF